MLAQALSIDDVKDFCTGNTRVVVSAERGTVKYSDAEGASGQGQEVVVERAGAPIEKLDFGELGYIGCIEKLTKLFELVEAK